MIELYFGLPGAGKTSLAVYFILMEQEKIARGKSPYKKIITNIDCDIPGVWYTQDFSFFGQYRVNNALIIWDESIIDFNSRKYKTFSDNYLYGFTQHRHHFQDVKLLSQRFDGLDINIRMLTEKVYYIHKGKINKEFTYVTPVKFGMQIPKKLDQETAGKILEGYYQCSKLEKLMEIKLPRSIVYPYFDSFKENKELDEVPDDFFIYTGIDPVKELAVNVLDEKQENQLRAENIF